jgi:hypothetical protein
VHSPQQSSQILAQYRLDVTEKRGAWYDYYEVGLDVVR